MAAIRLGIGAALAIIVTLVLFWIMPQLIFVKEVTLDEKKRQKIADFVMNQPERTEQLRESKVEKPQEAEKPPETPQMQQQTFSANAGKLDINFQGGIKDVDIANSDISGAAVSDGEYLPIVKVAPVYPNRAMSRGVSGYCTVQYTVTTTGTTRDPKAVDCKPEGYFESASERAALKFKYKPRVVNGQPVEVPGVRNKFTYELEK